MRFHATPLGGAGLIELEPRGDERGFFARMFCEREFAAEGLETRFVNVNNSLSRLAGTLRGLHYQLGEAAEVKLRHVLCYAVEGVGHCFGDARVAVAEDRAATVAAGEGDAERLARRQDEIEAVFVARQIDVLQRACAVVAFGFS